MDAALLVLLLFLTLAGLVGMWARAQERGDDK